MMFTPERTARLRKQWEQAVEAKEEMFTFDGTEVLTDYVGYVIEYLEDRFAIGKEQGE